VRKRGDRERKRKRGDRERKRKRMKEKEGKSE
jgi:hypothetical protein